MITKNLNYLKVNLLDWISGTIKKFNKMGIKKGFTKKAWNEAWFEVYEDLGGTSEYSGKKGCGKNAAYCLYKLGRIIGSNISFISLPYIEINKKLNEGGYGKNGCYAIIAYDLLITEKFEKSESAITIDELWEKVKQVYRKEIKNKKPADSSQGAVEVTFKLFHNNKLIFSHI